MKLYLKEGKDYTFDAKTSTVTILTHIPNGLYITTYDTAPVVGGGRTVKEIRVDLSLGDYLTYLFTRCKTKILQKIRLNRITKGELK